ncbi:hypothetical protein [Streptomyces sp. MMG1533]|uniref:hypothetical protein n=1 Tax=Streptomyces sp. MMG1533 TaxID=1415546 RepID=UPI00131D537D|nr:hypothetical protein [Streptomyces sp. MMG1533]
MKTDHQTQQQGRQHRPQHVQGPTRQRPGAPAPGLVVQAAEQIRMDVAKATGVEIPVK